jgi:hypothetical protein
MQQLMPEQGARRKHRVRHRAPDTTHIRDTLVVPLSLRSVEPRKLWQMVPRQLHHHQPREPCVVPAVSAELMEALDNLPLALLRRLTHIAMGARMIKELFCNGLGTVSLVVRRGPAIYNSN